MAGLTSRASSAFGLKVPHARPDFSRSRSRAVGTVRAAGDDEMKATNRRAALGALAGATALLVSRPSFAAYGEGANIFGKPTNKTGYIPYQGKGFALLIPSKWNPSKERDFKNTVFRWEDNYDPFSHVVITKTPTGKTSIDQVASVEGFFQGINYYLGEETWGGEGLSEGGLGGKVAQASLLDRQVVSDKNGRKYYKYDLITRAADNAEGGRHHLINAAVGSDGSLYVMKVQMGDKRWMRGAKNLAVNVFDSFTVG